MSQERLGELLGVSFQQVQKYEKAANRIALGRLLDISRALECLPSLFLDGLGHTAETVDPGLDRALATAGAIEIVTTFAAIKSSRLRRKLLELVRELKTSAT